VNTVLQDAAPLASVPVRKQLLVLSKVPDVGDVVKATVPVGVVAPSEAVSVTVAVQVVDEPVARLVGEHDTPVDVGSTMGVVVNVYGDIGFVPWSSWRTSAQSLTP
jgi:hypothetical protein